MSPIEASEYDIHPKREPSMASFTYKTEAFDNSLPSNHPISDSESNEPTNLENTKVPSFAEFEYQSEMFDNLHEPARGRFPAPIRQTDEPLFLDYPHRLDVPFNASWPTKTVEELLLKENRTRNSGGF